MNREQIQLLAKQLPRGLGGQQALLPLAAKNDPYIVGTPTHRAIAAATNGVDPVEYPTPRYAAHNTLRHVLPPFQF